jgi:Ca2+/H+ antiporter, TMEM165/GDT1 family
MDAATWALAGAVMTATIVEMVEALTIVMAMGMTRSWRSTLLGVAAALVSLAVFTVAAGYALSTWLPEAALKLVVGTLLLIFGLQWLRKAVLRSSGRKALHDEDEIYAHEVAQAQAAGQTGPGLDWFSFVVSFKGVFLEGVEVVFIVITFGLNADNMPVAVITAAVGVVAVTAVGVLARAPLSRVPENQLKYAVGLLLATFGTYWAVGGLGVIRAEHHSIEWPGQDLALLVLLVSWLAVSRLLVRLLRVPGRGSAALASPAASTTTTTGGR